MKRFRFIRYTLTGINEWLKVFEMDLKNIRFIRMLVGGKWYKQTMSGELPNCFGSWWTRQPLPKHRYHYIEKIENYGK